jgi:hypothetical protein
MVAALVVVALMFAACGSSDDDLPGDAVCIPEGSENPATECVGLEEADAVDLAAEQGLELREVGRDGECFPTTMDYREDRVNVEYVDGVVVGAGIF